MLKATARYFGTLAGALLVIVFGVSACWNTVYPTNSFRYRLTVEVDTPEGVKSGSSVIEVTERQQPKFGDAPSGQMSIKGEAVTVDLGARGLLFVLLKGASQDPTFRSDAGVIVYDALPPPGRSGAGLPENLRRYQKQTLAARLTLAQMPLMVRFRDATQPSTVERVHPGSLPASFGPGVRLREATLSTTRDPVTRQVSTYLKWLGDYYDKSLDGRRFQTIESELPLANSLASGSFSSRN